MTRILILLAALAVIGGCEKPYPCKDEAERDSAARWALTCIANAKGDIALCQRAGVALFCYR